MINGAVVVTGTSSGMGMHAAVELARRGCDVVATMRDTSRDAALQEAARAAGVTVEVRQLDVTDHPAAAATLAQVAADHGGIGALVNNAGQGCVGTAEMLDMATIEAQLAVNYLAPVALTKMVLPGMREAGAGRILTVTSVGGAVGQPFADAYCGAKFAVEGFMQSLAAVMEAHGVWVGVVEPAAVASEFVSNAVRLDGGPYQAQLDAYIGRSTVAFANAQTAQSAGVAIADALLADSFTFRHQTSDAARAFAGVSLADIDGHQVRAMTAGWTATN